VQLLINIVMIGIYTSENFRAHQLPWKPAGHGTARPRLVLLAN